MEDDKIYDEHHLYISNGSAKEREVEQALQKVINECKITETDYKINLLQNADKYFGYGYIWVASTKLYWLLLGTPQYKGIEEVGASWSSTMEKNEENEESPFIPLTYTNAGEKVILEVSRAFVYEPEPKYMRNRLCARDIPNFVTVTMLKKLFEGNPYIKFIERKQQKGEGVEKGVENKGQKEKSNRIVFITFDRYGNDALFALLMSKKVFVTDPKTKTKSIIYFNYAYTR